MAEPFKNLVSPKLVDDMGKALARSAKAAGVPFDARKFTRDGKAGLESLELKARALHVATALRAALPESFDTIATVIEGSLAAPATSDALGSLRSGPDGLAGWAVWPLTLVVEHTGLTHPKRALACLRELTMRFSSEWAIRAFVERHQPPLVLSGHIHESPRVTGRWRDTIGRTAMVNPGQFGHPKLAGVWFDPARPAETLRHTTHGE